MTTDYLFDVGIIARRNGRCFLSKMTQNGPKTFDVGIKSRRNGRRLLMADSIRQN